MGRNPEIDAILEAWWEFDHCVPPEKSASEQVLNELLDKAVEKTGGALTRSQILDCFWSQYLDYRKGRYKNDKLGVPRSALRR